MVSDPQPDMLIIFTLDSIEPKVMLLQTTSCLDKVFPRFLSPLEYPTWFRPRTLEPDVLMRPRISMSPARPPQTITSQTLTINMIHCHNVTQINYFS